MTEKQWNLIYRYFKTTCEPYDDLEFDGTDLKVWLDGEVVEHYPEKCLKEIIEGID
ncbi:MAG: hypothetical protein ACR2NQ_04770 [Thermodesulfobacteriota bacterium]